MECYIDKCSIRSSFNQMTINALYGQKMEKGLNCPESVKEMLLLFWECSFNKAFVKLNILKEVKSYEGKC